MLEPSLLPSLEGVRRRKGLNGMRELATIEGRVAEHDCLVLLIGVYKKVSNVLDVIQFAAVQASERLDSKRLSHLVKYVRI